MNNATKFACSDEGHGFSGLTIHLRSGDLLTTEAKHPQARFLPCSYHDSVIDLSNLSDVRIVTEQDLAHPCVAAIRDRHGDRNVFVQSGSVQSDACALMTAHNLEYGDSTFAHMAELLNENAKEVSMPALLVSGRYQWYATGSKEDPFGVLRQCSEDEAHQIAHSYRATRNYNLYRFFKRGTFSLRSSDDALHSYMLSAPASAMIFTKFVDG